ncbi:MAG: LytTR family transcriptional regulator DNA-binding domain-containing protein [Bacteroidota bacterium]
MTEVIISLCLSMVLFLIDEWYKKEQLIKALKQRQLESESSLADNQINPHLLFNSLNSIYVMLDKKVNTQDDQNHIFIKSDGMVIKVFLDDITYIETANDYVYINTVNKDRYLTLVSLKNIEKELPKEKFMRVHRYYLIGIDHVNKLEGNLIHIGKTKIKISRALRNQVYKSIIGTKLIER